MLGPLVGLLALCALSHQPPQWMFSWATALLWSENHDQASGLHLWRLNSPLSYAPRTMGFFLHKMGTRGPVMGL